jgi:hypothetical protein
MSTSISQRPVGVGPLFFLGDVDDTTNDSPRIVHFLEHLYIQLDDKQCHVSVCLVGGLMSLWMKLRGNFLFYLLVLS